MRATLENDLRNTMKAGLADGCFPGCVLLVGHGSQVVFEQAVGSHGAPLFPEPVQHDTIYDLASITKIFTATALLFLMENGAVDLHAPIEKYLPEFDTKDHKQITVLNLLTHTSGIAFPLAEWAQRHTPHPDPDLRPSLLHELRNARIEFMPPERKFDYAGLNYLLIQEIIERSSDQSLQTFLRRTVWDVLGMSDTQFNPSVELRERIPPTEDEQNGWRKQVIKGICHDESAYLLGGIAGHAGLFSTAHDLFKFAQMWFLDSHGPSPLKDETRMQALHKWVDNFPSHRKEDQPEQRRSFGIGWYIDRKDFMSAAPEGTIGMMGYTGTSIFVNPIRRLSIILLSNATYPRRKTRTSREPILRKIADLVFSQPD